MNNPLNSKDFQKLYSASKSLLVGDLLFKYKQEAEPRLGLIVSRRYGGAVQRNVFKRRCRCLFQQLIKEGFQYSLIIQPRKKNLSFRDIEKGFMLFNQRISLKS